MLGSLVDSSSLVEIGRCSLGLDSMSCSLQHDIQVFLN
jgi:hypothetical protein